MSGVELVALGVLLLLFLPIVYFDTTERRIPDLFLVVLLGAGLAYQIARAPRLMAVGQSMLGVLATAVVLFAIILILRALKRPAAIGGGDLKLLVASSAWLGFVGATGAFVLAAVASVLWALAVSPWQGFDLKREMPFAPFLAVGALAMFVVVSLSS